MQITEVRIKLVASKGDKLRGFCSITIDDCFVIRDLKIIEGGKGPFVAMPSRKLMERCHSCGGKNHHRASFCNDCGAKLSWSAAPDDPSGRQKLHADIAHPINSTCRELVQRRVLDEYRCEMDRAKDPNYQPPELDDFEEESLAEAAPGAESPYEPAYGSAPSLDGPSPGATRFGELAAVGDDELVDSSQELPPPQPGGARPRFAPESGGRHGGDGRGRAFRGGGGRREPARAEHGGGRRDGRDGFGHGGRGQGRRGHGPRRDSRGGGGAFRAGGPGRRQEDGAGAPAQRPSMFESLFSSSAASADPGEARTPAVDGDASAPLREAVPLSSPHRSEVPAREMASKPQPEPEAEDNFGVGLFS